MTINKDLIKNLTKNKFIQSSTIVLAGSLGANVLNYVFNLVMGRMLTPAQYGEVATLVTLVMIVSVPSATLTLLMAKYIAEYQARNERRLMSALFKVVTRYSTMIGVVLLAVFLILVPVLSSFFTITIAPLMIFSLLLPLSLLAATARGTLQGLQKFSSFSILAIIESVIKLAVSVVLVMLGWSVVGVMIALVIGSLVSYGYSMFKTRPHIRSDSEDSQQKHAKTSLLSGVSTYTIIIFLTTLLTALINNIDVILAKHYLTPDDAGLYAALAVLGRIILYGSTAVVAVMLPMISASHATDAKRSSRLFAASLGAVLLVSGIATAIFFIAPERVIRLLFGSQYLAIAPQLGFFGLAMLMVSLSTVFINYFLASHRKEHLYPFGIIVVLHIVLLTIFNESIAHVTYIMLFTGILQVIAMVVIYLSTRKRDGVIEIPEQINVIEPVP